MRHSLFVPYTLCWFLAHLSPRMSFEDTAHELISLLVYSTGHWAAGCEHGLC